MPEITIENLTVRYKSKKESVTAINGLNVTFLHAFNVVLGYSGCGKTTLLKTLIGLNEYSGRILFDGKDIATVPTNMRNMAMVSQQYLLYPNKTIFDNIAFPLTVMKTPTEEIKRRVADIADKLDLNYCLTRKPAQISGGQQQRVALARALVKRPSVCLLDEPLSNVDQKSRAQARALIKNVLSSCACSVIYVTHNVEEALALADDLIVMDEGKVVISGTPSFVFGSDNEIVASLKSGLYGCI